MDRRATKREKRKGDVRKVKLKNKLHSEIRSRWDGSQFCRDLSVLLRGGTSPSVSDLLEDNS